MNKKVIIFSILIIVFVSFLSGCANSNRPKYTGMTMSSNTKTLSNIESNKEMVGLSYLSNKEEDKIKASIISIANKNFDAVSYTTADYYFEKGNTAYVTVHVDNPENFEIQSFTLNGTKYSSYMFESGSDMENLILKVSIPETTENGYTTFTLDNIKYIDGTTIKDVALDAEQSVNVGVTGSQEVTSTIVTNNKASITTFSCTATLTDVADLVSADAARIVLIDTKNSKIIASSTLETTATLESAALVADSEYVCAVVACYDDLTGESSSSYAIVGDYVLINTAQTISLTITQDSCTWAYSKTAISEGLVIDKVVLGETSLTEAGTFSELYSNKAYSLVVSYRTTAEATEVLTETIVFTTLDKVIPIISSGVVSATQDSISWPLVYDDTDKVLTFVSCVLTDEAGTETTITADLPALSSFSLYSLYLYISSLSLYSNETYKLRATFAVSANHEVADEDIVIETTIKTLDKYIPTISIEDKVSTLNSIAWSYEYKDSDAVLSFVSCIIENEAGDKTTLTNETILSQKYLLSNETYKLTVTYSVDANHRVADEDIVIETTIKTKEKLDPVVSMSSVTGVYDGKTDVLSISFTPLLSSNPDAVSFSSLIYTLYTADNVATKYTGSFEFGSEVTLTGIAPDTDYYVVLSYVIDKNEAETYKKAYTSDSFHTTKVYGLTLTDIDYVTSSEDITIHASDSIMTLSTIQYFRMILTADALATGYEITNFEDYMNKFDMISLWAQGCGIDDGCIIENNDNAVILIKENQIYLYLPLETSNADGITKDQMQYADKYFYRDDTSFSSIYWERRDNHHCNYLLNLVYKANDLEYVLYNGMYAMYTTSNILK